MSPLVWIYAPFLRPDVALALTEQGQLVGAYRKKRFRYVVTYDLIRTEAEHFGSEDAAREHLQAVADRRWPS